MPRVAIVAPQISGGVKTVFNKLCRGLKKEGVDVEVLQLHGSIPLQVLADLVNGLKLMKYDVYNALIYMGSIPWLSHVLPINSLIKGLFLHGYVDSELISTIRYGNTLKARMGALTLYTIWQLSKLLDKMDFYICHSITACEVNNVKRGVVLLPQF
ncbi:MAG: hypothetical protein ACPLSM_06765, partial [Thermosphaera sp.]